MLRAVSHESQLLIHTSHSTLRDVDMTQVSQNTGMDKLNKQKGIIDLCHSRRLCVKTPVQLPLATKESTLPYSF